MNSQEKFYYAVIDKGNDYLIDFIEKLGKKDVDILDFYTKKFDKDLLLIAKKTITKEYKYFNQELYEKILEMIKAEK